jgi:ubiquinone/menaquinone biosynthesis C-methylase UbiE
MARASNLKNRVRDFWNAKSCGETYATGKSEREYYESHSKARFSLEPYIIPFAGFHEGQGKDVLEVGVGMGADHVEWAKSKPRSLTGIDITPRAIEHTRRRLAIYGLKSDIRIADAEHLPFDPDSFDLVYSWGVLHHSPNTSQGVAEVFRVLRPSGTARIMIYHKYSLTGYMLWLRYALLAGRPYLSLAHIYANYLESPGTKAYTIGEARSMFSQFSQVKIKTQLSFGDLLEGSVGQRHTDTLLTVAKHLWPRPLLRRAFKNHGLMQLIEARK